MAKDTVARTATDTMPTYELKERLNIGLNETYRALEEGIIPGAFRIGRRGIIPRVAAEKKLRGESV